MTEKTRAEKRTGKGAGSPSASTPPVVNGRGITVIFKGSDRCNAGCRFCSVGDPKGKVISRGEVDRVVDNLRDYVAREKLTHLSFTFHGGEPTLLGAPMIRYICEQVKTLPTTLDFKMQSNLMSLPDDVMAVLDEFQISVGTSIDPIGGDRIDPAGNDAFPLWLHGYLKMAATGKRAPGGIYVATATSKGSARRLYRIAQAIGAAAGQRFGLQVNPVYCQGRAAEGEQELLITPRQFGEYLIEIWRAWEENDRDVTLTPIAYFAECFPMPLKPSRLLPCIFNGSCSRSHVGINYDLKVAGCGRRLDSKKFMGSLETASLADILASSDERIRLASRGESLRSGDCVDCPYFDICHGGCPDDSELATGDTAPKFPWCESYRMLFDAMNEAYGGGAYVHRRAANTGISNHPQQKVTLHLVTDPDVPPPFVEGDPPAHTWILPTADGAVLKFGSSLSTLPERTRGPVRLWLHNGQVRTLPLWERFLSQRGVSVGLFESDGLEDAANLLNSLGARIFLDTAAICSCDGGVDSLTRVVKRFLFDPLWKTTLYPFSEMVRNISNRRPFIYRGVTGWFPCAAEPVLQPDLSASTLPPQLMDRLAAESTTSLAQWVIDRRPCMECPHLRSCNATMAQGNGQACDPRLFSLVEKVSEAVSGMIREVKEARTREGAR